MHGRQSDCAHAKELTKYFNKFQNNLMENGNKKTRVQGAHAFASAKTHIATILTQTTQPSSGAERWVTTHPPVFPRTILIKERMSMPV